MVIAQKGRSTFKLDNKRHKNMIKAIFFDFDGTIADTAPGIVRTMEETFRVMNLPIPAEEDMRATIGLPLSRALQILNDLSDEQAEEAATTYRKLFPTYEAKFVNIFPDITEILQWLENKGIKMSIVTSRGADSLELIMRPRGIADFFEYRITNDDNLTPKPAPDMVLTLLERSGLQADEVLVVGDTTFDIGMGNNAGCRTIAVTYGNHSLDKLKSADPTFIIDSFTQLKDIILNY